MRAALILGLVLLVASPALADEAFTRALKEALASEEPTTAVLRGLAKLPDFELGGAQVAESLKAAGATPEGQVAQVLGGVERVKKEKNRITIVRKEPQLIPIVVSGTPKGFVKLSTTLEFRLRSDRDAVLLDDFKGIEVGKTEAKLYDLQHIKWTPGEPESTLSIRAGLNAVFAETLEFKFKNGPAEKPVEKPAAVPASGPTPGILGRMR